MKKSELNKAKRVLTKLAAERIEYLRGTQSKYLFTDKAKWIKLESQITELDIITRDFCGLTVKKFDEKSKIHEQ